MNGTGIKRRFRAVVVGAGPAGSISALSLARTGLFDVHLVDRARFPRVKPCAGGLGPGAVRALTTLGLWERIGRETYPIQALKLTTASGRTTLLAGPTAAGVLPRTRLDLLLCEAAVKEGVRFADGWPVHRLLKRGGRVCGAAGPEGALEADLTILAAGGHSSLAGASGSRHQRMMACAWQPVRGSHCVPHAVEMVQDPELLPHYAWLFPESEDRANIGVCMDVGKVPSNRIRQTLERMAGSHFASALRGAERGRMRVAPIKCSVWPSDLAEPGMWVAGEAAGLANWSTGEGIAQGIRSGMLVGGAAGGFSEAGEERCRKLYEASVKSVLGPGLMGALAVRFAVMANVFEFLTLIPAGLLSGLGSRAAARLVAAK